MKIVIYVGKVTYVEFNENDACENKFCRKISKRFQITVVIFSFKFKLSD